MASPIQPVTARDAVPITPSDATVLNPMPAALYVATGGDLTVTTASGSQRTLLGVPDGAIVPLTVSQVRAATTASGIVGLVY